MKRTLRRCELDLHAGVVESRAAAEIGERIGREGVGRIAILRVVVPQPFREHYGAGAGRGTDLQIAADLAQLVEDANSRSVRQSACGGGDAQATELILEYQLEDYLRVQANVAENSGTQRVTFRRIERAGLDLLFFFSF